MKSIFSTATLIGLMAAAVPSLATPTSIDHQSEEPRFIEDLILAAIVGFAKGELAGLGPETPGCTQDADGDANNQWWTRAYTTADDGNNVTVAEFCWTGGGYSFNDDDVSAASCLLDLHAAQATTCIDLDGSSCNNYANTAVGNVRAIYDLDTGNDQQLDAASADKAKDLLHIMNGFEHGWDISTYLSIYPMNDDGTYTSWSIQVRGTASDDC